MKRFRSDIDIDVGDRQSVLKLIKHVAASSVNDDKIEKHNTGIYVTDIPNDPNTNQSTIDYREAEERGYIKLDILNVSVYNQIHSEEELDVLLERSPPWHRLSDSAFFERIIHIGNAFYAYRQLDQPVDSIERMAMFLALIRPAKRHLIGSPWKTIEQSIWQRPDNDDYYFKKSHGTAYAHLVAVHMNLVDLTD